MRVILEKNPDYDAGCKALEEGLRDQGIRVSGFLIPRLFPKGEKPGGLLDVNEGKDETKEGRRWKIKGEEG